MDLKVFIFTFALIFGLVNCAGQAQEDPPTNPPTTAKSCGGWFGPKCEATTTTTTATTTTTTPAPTPAPACGGWFQSACEPKPLALTVTTTTPPPTTTSAKPCGGWFQSACVTALALTTTSAPPPTHQYCGGIFGFFQHECPTTTPTPTPAPLTQSCGWLYCVDLTTTTITPPKPKSWGLFGTYAEASSTPAPAKGGWISGVVSGLYGTVDSVKNTANLAVDTALDVTSKIATASMNGGIDFLINQVKLVAKTTNMDVVPLPDLDIPLYPGAKLTATGGYFKSLLSISRGGDIVISRDGMAFIIDFPVEIKNMEIGFKSYEITVLLGMGTSGEIKVGVKENQINIRIRLAISTSCAINLEKVDFAVLDGLDIQMTYGCSMCGFITDKATSYLANFLKNTIRVQIQGQIDSILRKTLSENALICSKFMGK